MSSPHPTATASCLNKETLQGGCRAECTIRRCEYSVKTSLESKLRSTETACQTTISSISATQKNRKHPTASYSSGLKMSFVEHWKNTPVSRFKPNSIGANDLGKRFCSDETSLLLRDSGRKTLNFRGRMASRTSSTNSRKRFNSLIQLLGLSGEPIAPEKQEQVVAALSTPVTQERCTDDFLRRAREEAWTMATRQSMYIIARYRSQASLQALLRSCSRYDISEPTLSPQVAKLQSQVSESMSPARHSNGVNANESNELRILR